MSIRIVCRRAWLGGIGLVGMLTICGCEKPTETAANVALDWSVSPSSPSTGTASFLMKLTNRTTGEPVSGAKIVLEGNMAHAGMTPVFGKAQERTRGMYEAQLQFTMAGDWIVRIDADLPYGETVQQDAEVRVRGDAASGMP